MASSTNIPISVQRRDQRNAVLAGFARLYFVDVGAKVTPRMTSDNVTYRGPVSRPVPVALAVLDWMVLAAPALVSIHSPSGARALTREELFPRPSVHPVSIPFTSGSAHLRSSG